MKEKPDCDSCRAACVAFQREPECEPCTEDIRKDQCPSNHSAIHIWLLTERQFILGMGGPVDVNHVPVWEAIDRYKKRDPVRVFEKVLRLHNEITMAEISEEEDGE